MMDQQNVTQMEVPSLRKIVAATVAALIVAGVILVTVVLPAEYGIDPLGTGKALGLGDLARATEPAPARGEGGSGRGGRGGVDRARPRARGQRRGARVRGAFIAQPGRYQIDSREMTLAPGEGMEIKYDMKKGAGLIFSWTASAKLAFEFHGDPDVKPAGKEGTDYFESYELDDKTGKDQSHATFVAPSTGIHGWFWENKTDKDVTLKLVSAGFYDWIMQNRKDKQTALKPMDPYALPGHPKIPDESVLR